MQKAFAPDRSLVAAQAAGLMSQQVWCWGRDILRPQGNWLVELGFQRIQPPADRQGCPSVYRLDLPEEGRVVLRGFGVFYGDRRRGCVFLPRHEFQPRYTAHAMLDCPPESPAAVAERAVSTPLLRTCYASLVLDAVDWIQRYEAGVIQRLGMGYRRSTLIPWDDGRRTVVPAEDMVEAWAALKTVIAA